MSVARTSSFVVTVVCIGCATNSRVWDGLNHTPAVAPACAEAPPLDSLIHDTTEVATRPVLSAYPDLHYPDRAREKRISGSVEVFFVVGSDGLAESASIRAIGGFDEELNTAAAQFVGASRYWPGCLRGQPVRVRTRQRVDFRISIG